MAAAPTIGLRHVTVVPTNFVPPSGDGDGRPEPSREEHRDGAGTEAREADGS